MEEDLVIALSVLLEVDEAAARGIAARLGLGGRLAGNQFAAGFQKAATSGTAKAAGAVGKAASSGGSQKQAGVAAGQQFVDGYKTALTQIVSVTRASLKDQSAIQRQGTKGGQVDVDAQRAALDRRTLEKRRREYELGNEYKTRNAVELADVKRHNASLIAADQQAGVRRTVLIRTMLNNMTRINQTALSGILSMWKSHQQRKLQDEASFNRRAEMELQSSMSRRTSIIRSATKEQVAAQQQAMTPSDKFNQASSTGVLGVATGRSYALGGLIGGALGARTAYNILGEFQFIETAFKGIFDEVEGRAPKTQEFLKEMQDFARESPYDFEQVARSAQKMFATRVVNLEELGYDKATDSVINRLQVLADAAAASGKTSAQMELALNGLGQIGSVGQLMMEEVRQVTENLGLPIEEVARSLGMSVAEMREAMKAGEIDAETGLNAMFDAMTRIPGAAGAAARQAKTLRGAMSQLADVGKQMMVQFLMPVAKGFTAIALAFTNVGGALVSSGGGWKVVRDGLRGVIAALSAIVALKGAIEIVKILGFALSAAVSAPVITGFAVLVGLLSSFDGVRETLAALAEGTKNWFLVGYRAKAVVDDFSGFVKVMTTIGKFARTVQDFTKALVVGTKDWFLVGYRISGVIDEFSNIVLFQTSLGAAARVIVNALRGIWDALGALANTRDFGEFRKALGKIAEDAGKAFSPIKDALAKQFGLGVDAAKRAAEKALKAVVGWVGDNMDSIVAGARVASGGALILRMLGLAKGGNFLGAAQLGIGVAIASALIGAAKSLATNQTSSEFAKSIDAFLEKAIDRAFDAAVIVTAIGAKLGGLVGDVWGSLFGDDKGGGAADPKASLSVADKIAGTLTAAWEKASVLLSGLASSVSEWFTTTFTSWLINLPYKIGELLSSTILEDEVIQAVGTIAAGVAAAAVVVGLKFAQGFIMGIIRSIPDIARMFRDAISGTLGGDIGTEFAGAMLTSIVAAFVGFKGFKAIAGAFAKLQIGFDASGPRAARNELAKLKVEAQGSGSKIADLGMKARRAAEGFIKINYNWGEVQQTAAKTTRTTDISTRALTLGRGALAHYADGWRKAADGARLAIAPFSGMAKSASDALGPKFRTDQKKSNELMDRFKSSAGSGANAFHRMGDAIMRTTGLVETANGRFRSSITNKFVADPTKDLSRMERAVGQAFQRMGDTWNTQGSRINAGVRMVRERFGSEFAAARKVVGGHLTNMGIGVRLYASNANERLRATWRNFRGDASNGAAALSASMSIAAGAFSGYMAGMSQSGAAMTASMLAAAGSIAQAWAAGGPILGSITTAVTYIGYLSGSIDKHIKKLKGSLEQYSTSFKESFDGIRGSISTTFSELGNAGEGSQRIALLDSIKEQVAQGDVDLGKLRDRYGIFMLDIVKASEKGADGLKGLFTSATRGIATGALEGDIQSINTVLAEMTDSGTNYDRMLNVVFGQNMEKNFGGLDLSAKETSFALVGLQQVMDGKFTDGGFRKALEDFGLTAAEVDAVMESATLTLQDFLARTDSGAFFAALGPAMDKAIDDFKAQEIVTGELRQAMERLKTPVDRFASAWERVKGAIDKATTAFRTFMDERLGRELSIDQTTLSVLSSAEAALKPREDGQSDAKFQAEREVATAEARFALAEGAGVWARDSRTAEEAVAKMQEHLDAMIAGVTDPAMKEFLAGMRGDENVIAAIIAAFNSENPVENLTEFKERYSDLLLMTENRGLLDAISRGVTQGQTKQQIIASLKEIEKQSPAIQAYIVKAGGYDAVYDQIIADTSFLATLNPKIQVGFEILWGNLKESVNSILPSFLNGAGVGDKPKENWNGGLETSPVLSTLAERGPEAIFPLTNPARMRQIMGIPQVARAFDAAGFGAPITGNAAGTNYAPVSVDQSQVNHFEIHESSPRMTADEIFRRQRKARFHGGHTLPVVIR